MKQITINQSNYQMICGLSAATDAMQSLFNAGVAVTSITVVNGRGYIACEDASQIEDTRPISSHTHRGIRSVRALLCGCVLEWETKIIKDVKETQDGAA
ncbi:MAG: hypothetical protein CMI13_04255 [Oleibacter sp.]|nr:hypothetical protein [Thalassolituus sp.]|tara:strand:- start:335 stop:631 length:297 start_codon:yes stop_codon:yes gene_type:complete